MAAVQSILKQLFCLAVLFHCNPPIPTLAQSGHRAKIIPLAQTQLAVTELSGKNDGPAVKAYLNYVGLNEGHEWCAAFVSWIYGQAGYKLPRTAWSPALFPKALTIPLSQALPADIFGIWVSEKKRIGHVGLLFQKQEKYWICIEGNIENGVNLKRRHNTTLFRVARWTNP